MKKDKHVRSRSIATNTLIGMLLVLILQTGIFVVSIFGTGSLTALDHSALKTFHDRAQSRKNYLEMEFLHRWQNMDDSYHRIFAMIEENTKTPSADKELLLETLAPEMIHLMRANFVTGSFLILDSEGNSDKYGLYFRDTDPTLNTQDNSDLTIEVAPINLAKQYSLLHKSPNWTPRFQYNSFTEEQKKIYDRPIQAKTENPNVEAVDCGWWSNPMTFCNPYQQVITYTIPLMSATGVVQGVLGIELELNYLRSFIPYHELSESSTAQYVLIKSWTNDTTVEQSIVAGVNLDLRENTEINMIFNQNLIKQDLKEIRGMKSIEHSNKKIYLSVHTLQTYQNNSPFEAYSWTLISVIDSHEIHYNSTRLQQILLITVSITLIIGSALIVLFSLYTTRPIIDLTKDLKKSKIDSFLHLKKINIKEIDDLISAIETLNHKALDAENKLANIMNLIDIPIIVFEYDKKNNRLLSSKDLSEVLNFPIAPSEVQNTSAFLERIEPYIIYRSNSEQTYKYVDQNKQVRWIEVVYVNEEHLAGLIIDRTKTYLEKEKLIRERNYDELTNMYNRRAFFDRYDSIFERDNEIKYSVFLMMDLDNVKFINDNYGHEYGDLYLKRVSELIIESCKTIKHHLYGRRSGDEFCVFLYGYHSKEEREQDMLILLNQLMDASFYGPDGTNLKIKVSVGASFYPEDTIDQAELVKYADFAMYETKNSAKGEIKYFDREKFLRNQYILQSKTELNYILEKKQLYFEFQPIVSLQTGVILGYEAFTRTSNATFSSTTELFTIAKAHFLSNQLEKLAFVELAKKVQHEFQKIQEHLIFFSSTLDYQILENEITSLQTYFKSYLSSIVIEFMSSGNLTRFITKEHVQLLNKNHFKIAIDNFSSILQFKTLLKSCIPDYIKLDMSLIRNIHIEPIHQEQVGVIIEYAHENNIKTIAVGVETEEELKILYQLGCDYAQGRYFGKPNAELQPISEDSLKFIENLNYKK